MKTTAYRVGLTWIDGSYNGGSVIIDYRVSFTTANSETFTVYASGLPTTSAIVMGLTPGVTYKFYVQARNIKGFSLHSNQIEVLAAQVPDAPTSLANVAEITKAD